MNILVVEAEETTRKVMGVMLNRLGYKVELTSNCNEGFRAYCDRGPYDVVLIGMRFVRGSAGETLSFPSCSSLASPPTSCASPYPD